MKKLAFTLVEFLVIIFILFVLAAILFPILTRPPRPKRVLCQSNLKQISLGFKQYTQDYDEFFPAKFRHPAPISSTCMVCGFGWGDGLQPYLKSTQIFHCPDEFRQPVKQYQPWVAGYTDYYYNGRVAGKEETKFNNSANTVLMGEGNDGVDVNDARYMRSSIPVGWEKDTTSPIYRHLEGSNFAFVDRHVKWLKFDRHPTTKPTTGSNFTFSP